MKKATHTIVDWNIRSVFNFIVKMMFILAITGINQSIYSQDPLWIMGDQQVSFQTEGNPMLSPTPLPTPTPGIPGTWEELYYSG
jgi:hypothetical protein